MISLIPFCLIVLVGSPGLIAATINLGIAISNGGGLKDNSGTLLSSGLLAVDGDGAVIQIGYYSLATLANPFLGQWVPITGPGTPYPTSIGDGNNLDGFSKSTSSLVAGTFGFVEPAIGTPLALRFYDSSSLAASTYFNAVATTDGSFAWVAPSDPKSSVALLLPSSQIVWQDGSGSAFCTTIAIPELSSVITFAFATGGLAFRRRRAYLN